MKTVLSSILVAGVLSHCGSYSPYHSYTSEERQALPATQTAEEWNERFNVDLEESSFWYDELGYLYAELPPKQHWQDALQLAEDSLQKHPHHPANTFFPIFKNVLEGNTQEAEQILQTHLLKTKIDDHNRKDVIALLYALSSDPQATQAWIAQKKPDLLKPRKPYTSKPEKKEQWEKDLAEGKVDAALKQLWKIAKGFTSDDSDKDQALSQIYKVCSLLEREVEAQKAIDLIQRCFEKEAKDPENYCNVPYELKKHLANKGDWKQLEKLLKLIRIEDKDDLSSHDELIELILCSYYTRSPAAFVAEIEKLQSNKKLTRYTFFEVLETAMGDTPSIGQLYVEELSKAGRHEDAWAIASRLLVSKSSDDPYYALAQKTNKVAFPDLLDQLLAFDPFEERPLIWKAKLALTANDIEGADKWINQAITLDPSDGDQGKDSRMQAYAVLADVFKAKGNTEKEAFFREVVSAIREGEIADDYLYAGLIQEAIKRYKASLGRFNDAYCLQSRLALTLAKNGKFEEAIPHFEKAFTLMPVSFGPRESHCFGCEGLYSDERVHPIAERILTEFVEKNPENPRAPYLLGLVLNKMKKYDAANTAFQKALELDPDYYNAANKLLQNYKTQPQHQQQKAELIVQMLGFAPYTQIQTIFRERSDLAQAWTDAEKIKDSPLTLPTLSWNFYTPNKQYEAFNSYSRSTLKAMDGWSKSELLRDNYFLGSLSSDID
ncbi:tetratricopeptide repeat protein [Rubritalea tangerina]|uniref:Tetratricopeptide repeat protein n=1 Tax=Rubritalea tangerina TaxID=430798 RepID=A0ABW4Z8J1_9BACT